jgi:hypothetical protein
MNNAGRPPKFNNSEEMQQIIDAYFDKCKPDYEKDNEGKILVTTKGIPIIKLNPPTITGLALALGFVSRQSMYDYEKNEEFTYTIKNARLRCENWVENNLLSGNIAPASGIFALKNYGWRDNFGITNSEGGELNTIKIFMNSLSDEDMEKFRE